MRLARRANHQANVSVLVGPVLFHVKTVCWTEYALSDLVVTQRISVVGSNLVANKGDDLPLAVIDEPLVLVLDNNSHSSLLCRMKLNKSTAMVGKV